MEVCNVMNGLKKINKKWLLTFSHHVEREEEYGNQLNNSLKQIIRKN